MQIVFGIFAVLLYNAALIVQCVPTAAPTVDQLSPTYSCINASELVYNSFNEISVIASLIACLSNIQDAMLYPGYSSGKLLNVSTQIEINNLIGIDEVQNLLTIDIFLLLRWFDPRLSMPVLWQSLHPSVANIDISQAIQFFNVQGIQPVIWMPDVMFPSELSAEITNTYLKLFPKVSITLSII